jgi:hypothetical protein
MTAAKLLYGLVSAPGQLERVVDAAQVAAALALVGMQRDACGSSIADDCDSLGALLEEFALLQCAKYR